MLYQVVSDFETILDEAIKEWSNEIVCNSNSLLIQPITEIHGQTEWKDIKIPRMPVIGKIITVIREFDFVYAA